ncbi:MAG: hypothetical protein PHY44_01520 [Lachnospiraceae bacterium]|nr:hypothetical protein [Lachnospiraceae bacterium]
MKKYIRTVVIATAVCLPLGLITACNNKKEKTSAPVVSTETEKQTNTEEKDSKAETPKPENTTGEQTTKKESLLVELGNDMGHNLSALWIRATEDDEWTEITLENNVWQTGYLIPVKLEGDSIPNPKNGWQVKIEYADDNTTHIFENVLLNTNSSIVLTEEGPVY